jgi:hypothetical protein
MVAGCGAAPSAESTTPANVPPEGTPTLLWDAESVNDETQSTHLWIVNRAIDLLRAQGADANAAGAVAWLNRADCLPSWHQGLLDADFKAAYNDGRSDLPIGASTVQIALAGTTWASHFWDPDTNENYEGQTSPTGRTRITDQLANFHAAQASNVPSACYALGLALHYFTDLTQPMHASNYTAKDWPLELHSNWESYAMQKQAAYVTTEFTVPTLTLDALVNSVAHTSKSYWPQIEGAIATAYGAAKCSKFSSYYLDHTSCWEGNASVDAWIGVALQSAQSETAQFLYTLQIH